MSDTTSIEYADYTWSPWWGCTPVSPGCAHYYAARWAKYTRGLEYRSGVPRQLAKDWKSPVRWNEEAGLRDIRQRVLVSMGDPFDWEVDPAWRQRFFGLIYATPNLDWLLLTKRPGNARSWLLTGITAQVSKAKQEVIDKIAELEKQLEEVDLTPEAEQALADLKQAVQDVDDLNADKLVG